MLHSRPAILVQIAPMAGRGPQVCTSEFCLQWRMGGVGCGLVFCVAFRFGGAALAVVSYALVVGARSVLVVPSGGVFACPNFCSCLVWVVLRIWWLRLPASLVRDCCRMWPFAPRFGFLSFCVPGGFAWFVPWSGASRRSAHANWEVSPLSLPRLNIPTRTPHHPPHPRPRTLMPGQRTALITSIVNRWERAIRNFRDLLPCVLLTNRLFRIPM